MSFIINSNGTIRETSYDVEPICGRFATAKEAVRDYISRKVSYLNDYMGSIKQCMEMIESEKKYINIAKEELAKHEARRL